MMNRETTSEHEIIKKQALVCSISADLSLYE